jgi:hypothetical protein
MTSGRRTAASPSSRFRRVPPGPHLGDGRGPDRPAARDQQAPVDLRACPDDHRRTPAGNSRKVRSPRRARPRWRRHGGAPGCILEYLKEGSAPSASKSGSYRRASSPPRQHGAPDLNQISGINEAAMGQNDKVVSGRAVEARQKSAYVGAEMWFDNFARYQEQPRPQALGDRPGLLHRAPAVPGAERRR